MTCHGHMRSVRSLDYHPFGGEYIVSGSNDTSVRLWDIRSNQCIKKYRGHMANVNSVKFSPDGSWIASGGTEGSVIIWDIRMSKEFIQFPAGSPVTCVQFHPEEMLLGAGRNDGSVDLYDLEACNPVLRKTNTIFAGNTVKSITFSEKGDALFIGSTCGISAIGWEPDRDLGHTEATWNVLGDMKIKNSQLLCGAFEQLNAAVYLAQIDLILMGSVASPVSIVSNHPVRRSFNRGNGKLRLSIGNKASTSSAFSPEDGLSSPNLSIEMIEEEPAFPDEEPAFQIAPTPATRNMVVIDDITSPISPFYGDGYLLTTKNVQAEKEDFPINNAQPPDYTVRPLKTVSRPVKPTTSVRPSEPKKIASSVSTIELNKINNDDQLNYARRPKSRGTSPVRMVAASRIQKRADNPSKHNKHIPIQIMTKPQRSKSSIDMKLLNGVNPSPTQIPKYISYTDHHTTTTSNEEHDLDMLRYGHELIYNSLCNRLAALNMLRSPAYRNDINAMLRKAVTMGDNHVIVDLLGSIIEKSASCWNLDMCVILLPTLFELLQAEYKFHAKRACDTLREIITRFLPVIQQHQYHYSSSIGVDITGEERMKKCLQCRDWLLRIKTLPENKVVGLAQIQNMIVDI